MPNPPAAAAWQNPQQPFRIQQPNFNGAQVQEAQVQHNQQQQQNVNRLAENFGVIGLGQHDANGAHGIRAGDELRLFQRLLSSARVHAMQGREREMNNDLARARALAERPDARQTHGISMHFYENHARLTRRRLQMEKDTQVDRHWYG